MITNDLGGCSTMSFFAERHGATVTVVRRGLGPQPSAA